MQGNQAALYCARPTRAFRGHALRACSRLTVLGARPASQHPGHRPHRKALGLAQAQGLTFFGTHVRIGFLLHGNTVTQPGV